MFLENPAVVNLRRQNFSSRDGIAIGPILFVIAVLGILATVIAANMGQMSSTGITDRVAADTGSQANLIRTKILECNERFGTDRNFDGYPDSGGVPINVSAVSCTGDAVALGSSGNLNIWSGPRATTLPPATSGFGNWQYINPNTTGLGGVATGGRCAYIAPTLPNAQHNPGIVDGLTKAAAKFTSQTTCNNSGTPCTGDVIYDPGSASQKFVVWITLPTASPDSHCLP